MFTKRTSLLVAVFLMVLFLGENGFAQEPYPSRPVTVVIPWGAGGMADAIMRILCKSAEKEMGQPIVALNKPGAGGTIGVNFALKAKPDGYTIGAPVTSAYIVQPHTQAIAYNPLTDPVDITTVYKYNFGLAVKPDAPWNTFEDVIRYSKKNPGKFRYASAGVGTTQHICMERIAIKEGIEWTHVPFKSGAEAVVACLGGHTDAVAQGSADMVAHFKAGKLKIVVVLDNKRWPSFPNVPTVLEKGYNFYAMSYMSLNVPKGVPEPVIRKIEDVFNKAKKDPTFVEALEKFQVDVVTMTGKEYSSLWRSHYEPMGKIIKELGIAQK